MHSAITSTTKQIHINHIELNSHIINDAIKCDITSRTHYKKQY